MRSFKEYIIEEKGNYWVVSSRKLPEYLEIGHTEDEVGSWYKSTPANINKVDIWYSKKDGKLRIIPLKNTLKFGESGHSMVKDITNSILAGRIDHEKKMISFTNDIRYDNSSIIFSIAYDLQKKYPKYTIVKEDSKIFSLKENTVESARISK